MGAQPGSAQDMHWFRVPWRSGHQRGITHVRAPDAETARRDLQVHGAVYGLPHADPEVGQPVRILTRPYDGE